MLDLMDSLVENVVDARCADRLVDGVLLLLEYLRRQRTVANSGERSAPRRRRVHAAVVMAVGEALVEWRGGALVGRRCGCVQAYGLRERADIRVGVDKVGGGGIAGSVEDGLDDR
jgi:hypothetical protein